MAFLHRHGDFEPVIVTPEHIHRKIHSLYDPNNGGISFVPISDGLDADEPRNFFSINSDMENNMPGHLERIILSFGGGSGVACVVVDVLASWAVDVARRLGVQVAGFWPAMHATFNLIAAIPELVEQGLVTEFGTPRHEGSLVQSKKGQLQAISIKTEELPWLIGNPTACKFRFSFWVRAMSRCSSLPYLLLNSFDPSEPTLLHQQQQQQQQQQMPTFTNTPQVLLLGPLTSLVGMTKNPSFWDEDPTCLSWLDKQQPGSVIYVSFGSWVGPDIGDDRIRELALGLKATKRPFLWVLNSDGSSSSSSSTDHNKILNDASNKVEDDVLGKVVSWAPQREVLRHEAIGCYLTHCGWNSIMEAIEECAKPLLCCPIAGDQFVNCGYVVKVWGVGERMEGMRREEVERGVRRVMEGEGVEEMKRRMVELKERVLCLERVSKAKASLADFANQISINFNSITPNHP
ncbi:hypothetical protein Syun_028511 [Stephania yunnanensis]|uniref:Glycosyltransferase n=1 Tax=Stephania yunnanensis TaxID=152371 RepID=A0AAP0HS58_9MAGN